MLLSFRALLTYILPAALLVAVAGAYPAWRHGEATGVACELIAGVIVLAVMLGGGEMILRTARRDGLARASLMHVAFGVARPLACLALAAGAYLGLDLPPKPLAVWLVIFYVVMFAAELTWMLRAVRAVRKENFMNPPAQADNTMNSGAAVKGSDAVSRVQSD
jgi:hypothetical protein